jgi:hypothetical protein
MTLAVRSRFSPGMGSEQPPNPRSFHLAPKHPHLVTENQKLQVPFHARVMASQGETDVSSVDPMCLVLPVLQQGRPSSETSSGSLRLRLCISTEGWRGIRRRCGRSQIT